MRRLSYLCAAALITVVPGSAWASSIVYQGLGTASLVRVSVTGAGPAWGNNTIWAGEDRRRADPAAAAFEIYDSTLYAYCVALLKTLASPDGIATRSTDILSVSGVPQAGGRVAWRFNAYAPGIHSAAIGTPEGKVDANQSAIALQVAIWEAMLDTSNDVSSGTFKLNSTGAIRTKAMAYLSALYSGAPSGYDAGAATWLDTYRPPREIDLPGVPEPQSLVMLATGLAGLIAIGRWSRIRRSAGGKNQPSKAR